jgi:hypothetical protein
VLPLPEFQGQLHSLVWDAADPNVFLAFDGLETAYTYVHTPGTLSGPAVALLCKQGLYGMVPLVLSGGQLACRTPAGSLDSLALDSHRAWQPNVLPSKANMQSKLSQALKMWHLRCGAGDVPQPPLPPPLSSA